MLCLISIASNASSMRTWIFTLCTALSQHLKQFLAYSRAYINVFKCWCAKAGLQSQVCLT